MPVAILLVVLLALLTGCAAGPGEAVGSGAVDRELTGDVKIASGGPASTDIMLAVGRAFAEAYPGAEVTVVHPGAPIHHRPPLGSADIVPMDRPVSR